MSDNKYYLSSFFWTATAKIVNGIVGFISVPLLLSVYGKAQYGILGIATACNAYMHLLDLGMNTGAVKFYSQWKAEGKTELVSRVSHTNLTFYALIAFVNALVLISLALFGEGLFKITHYEFMTLRTALFIIAGFSLFSWVTTAFNQLLVADRQMAFTMKMQTVQALLKAVLIAAVFAAGLRLLTYFFLLTFILASLFIPYAVKCRRDNLIDNFKPEWHWKEFKTVLLFSLSVFALSLFQVTATESRPLVLSFCCSDASSVVADFRVLYVLPSLILTIGTSFSSIFLPRTAEMVAEGDREGITRFSYKWTRYTTILANLLCVPFILSAKEALSAYVGPDFQNLAIWLALWCLTILIQVHTTPGNSLVLAYGRMKQLVITTAVACVISIVINVLLCRRLAVGSAITGYLVYVIIVIGLYYFYYYKSLLGLSRRRMIMTFLCPTLCAFAAAAAVWFIPVPEFSSISFRLSNILSFLIRSAEWLALYALMLFGFRLLSVEDIKDLRR